MSTPASRPVHPCVVSLTNRLRGAEFAVWARLDATDLTPHLVTASSNSLTLYRVHPVSFTLQVEHSWRHLAGTVVSLSVLKATAATAQTNGSSHCDALLVGFAGHARLTLLSRVEGQWQSSTLIDLTSVVSEQSVGAVTPGLEQDVMVALQDTSASTGAAPGRSDQTVACILGGGVAVAVLGIQCVTQRKGTGPGDSVIATHWVAQEEPYILPLHTLELPHATATAVSDPVATATAAAVGTKTMATGFGDILHATFVPGYLEAVLVVLHTTPVGRMGSGRWGSGAPPTYCTALSISTFHARTALLWSVAVPTDAWHLSAVPLADTGVSTTSLVVVAVNSLTFVSASGRVQQCLAVNGWARSSAVSTMPLTCNPTLPLATQLDGARLSWMSASCAALVLRRGPVYMLQYGAIVRKMEWSLLPLGQTLGGIGEIADLVTLPLPVQLSPSWLPHAEIDNGAKKLDTVGLLFAGSRLGDSILLGFALETVERAMEEPLEHQDPPDMANDASEWDEILRLEDEALYRPVDETRADLIPASDDEESPDHRTKRVRIDASVSPNALTMTVVHTMHPLDRLVHLGPLGPSCQGPLGRPPSYMTDAANDVPAGLSTLDSKKIFGALAHIFPTGYGSSGGLALMTAPGRDDRMIVAEEDCLHVACLFSLPLTGVVLMGMSPKASSGGGMRVFRLDGSENEAQLTEEYVEEWCSDTVGTGDSGFADSWEAFQSTLLSAGEGTKGMLLFVVRPRESTRTVLLIANNIDGKIELVRHRRIDWNGKATDDIEVNVIQVTPIEHIASPKDSGSVFCCVWSNGDATMITVTNEGDVKEELVTHKPMDATGDDMDVDAIEDDQETRELKEFYSNDCIVAVDLFQCSRSAFEPRQRVASATTTEATRDAVSNSTACESDIVTVEPDDLLILSKGSKAYAFDEDEELYAMGGAICSDNHVKPSAPTASTGQEEMGELATYLAVCHQSGNLEIYPLTSLHTPLWRSRGVGIGSSYLRNESNDAPELRNPRSQISVKEVRFFHHGLSTATMDGHSRLCFSVVLTDGDLVVYELEKTGGAFRRKPLSIVARASVEQSRHHAKLSRKGVLGRNNDDNTMIEYNTLHRFSDISGQAGLFAAGPRPLWLVSESGELSVLVHRLRHAAPAGAKPRPVSGFCSSLKGRSGYITLHERVGRVGSQRLTIYRGLSSLFDSVGVMTGAGFCVEKIPLGVTVRQIVYLDDESLSTGDHPLYAVLVSRELEVDQSELNSDGLTDEERQQIEEERTAARIYRQVEADLGGFEVESEWVEAIERENCFRVDVDLGGAPPIHQSVYSLWIVDAANDWLVVDSYELEEHEHGIDLKVLSLTEFSDEPGSTSGTTANEDSTKRHFLAVGTGVVNHDGEDVGTKGRLLLFEVRRLNEKTAVTSTAVAAELSLAYEKNIFHGPVTTASCLSSEGVNRLVIGAGSDVNIEQWGNSKLTQVGFFRATMHILDIMHFKNFLLLSDAYDSLYFLVWRESDKSLTLLAKDYDPIPVHAAGVMARGAAMTFVCHDDRQNLQFFQYAPGEAAARGGNKLVCRADFHLGTQTTAFRSHFCQPSLLVHSATPASTLCALKQQDALFGRQDDDQRLGVHFGTTDGSVGSIVPLSEPVYWRLMALQSVMSNALESDFALNHRAWRLYRRTPRRGGCRSSDRKKGAIDGDLVLQYADLATTDQEDIASAIGSTVGLILDNLLEVQCGSMIM